MASRFSLNLSAVYSSKLRLSALTQMTRILAAAVQSAERYGAMLLLSNDFETFHTPEMKAFLAEHGVLPVSLYGLLKLVGRR